MIDHNYKLRNEEKDLMNQINELRLLMVEFQAKYEERFKGLENKMEDLKNDIKIIKLELDSKKKNFIGFFYGILKIVSATIILGALAIIWSHVYNK